MVYINTMLCWFAFLLSFCSVASAYRNSYIPFKDSGNNSIVSTDYLSIALASELKHSPYIEFDHLLESIEEGALMNADVLHLNLSTTQIEYIPKDFCRNCNNLKFLFLPETLIAIHERAFYTEGDLSEDFVLPASLEIIKDEGLRVNLKDAIRLPPPMWYLGYLSLRHVQAIDINYNLLHVKDHFIDADKPHVYKDFGASNKFHAYDIDHGSLVLIEKMRVLNLNTDCSQIIDHDINLRSDCVAILSPSCVWDYRFSNMCDIQVTIVDNKPTVTKTAIAPYADLESYYGKMRYTSEAGKAEIVVHSNDGRIWMHRNNLWTHIILRRLSDGLNWNIEVEPAIAIRDYQFYGSKYLNYIDFGGHDTPEYSLNGWETKISRIGKHAFQYSGPGVYNFSTIDAYLTRIDEYAFADIPFITNDVLLNNIEYIGTGAFSNTNINHVVLKNVKHMGDEAFSHNIMLDSIDIYSAGGTAGRFDYFGERVFMGTSAKHVRLFGDLPRLYSNTFEKTLLEYLEIFGDVNEVEDDTFKNMVHLKEVYLRGHVVTIGKNAFKNSPLQRFYSSTGLKYIGNSSFENTDLTHFEFHLSVERIGSRAFRNSKLSGILDIPGNVRRIEASSFEFTNIEEVHIHEGVTYLGENAFRGTLMMKRANIPSTITVMPPRLFESSGLHHISFDDGIRVIKEYAFANTEISTITFPVELTHIYQHAFLASNISGGLIIPDHVKFVGKGAFLDNHITNLTILGSLEYIHVDTFRQNHIRSVSIPPSVRFIGFGAFRDNDLTYVKFPYELKTLKKEAFIHNDLQSVYLPIHAPEAFDAYVDFLPCRKNESYCTFDCDVNCHVCDKSFCLMAGRGYFIEDKQPKACADNCEECVNASVCTIPSLGHYLEDGIPSPCMDNCASCDALEVCNTAMDGFFIYGDVPVPCKDDCIKCDNTGMCTEHEEGYFWETPRAIPCDSGCDRCYGSNCLQPATKFYLEPYAKECDEGCDQCVYSKCLHTRSGYYIDEKMKPRPCETGCANCTSGICTDTLDGYVLVDEQPQACVEGCKTCTPDDICLEVFEGYTFFNDITYCGNGCVSCNRTHCLEARDGYNLLDNGQLAIICEEGCKRCNSIECLEAKDGYYLHQWWSGQGYSLYRCEDNCKRCNSNGYCIEADEGYTLVDGTPTPGRRRRLSSIFRFDLFRYGYGCDAFDSSGCIDPMDGHRISINITSCEENCAACDLEKCTRAKDGFRLVNDVPQACVDGCKNCEDGTCTEAFDGFYMVNNVPHACEDECATCDATRCLMYKYDTPGYFRSYKNYPVPCMNGCDACNKTHCFIIADGYVRDTNDTILACPSNCKECTTDGVCLAPMPNYRLDNQTLIQCPIDCDECNEHSCLKARPGAWLITDGFECEPNCARCTFTECYEAKEGFQLVDQILTPCPVGCSRCFGSQCLSASEGYRLQDGIIQSCGTNCAVCNASNCIIPKSGFRITYRPQLCLEGCDSSVWTLADGYFFDIYGIALRCPDNCKKCNNDGICITPMPGYRIDSNNGQLLINCTSNCKVCNNGGCITPMPGYRISSDGSLVPCPQDNCEECSESICLKEFPTDLSNGCETGCDVCVGSECLIPSSGYYLREENIVACEDNCAVCDASHCITPKDGYVIVTGPNDCPNMCICEPTECLVNQITTTGHEYGLRYAYPFILPCREGCKTCTAAQTCTDWRGCNYATCIEPMPGVVLNSDGNPAQLYGCSRARGYDAINGEHAEMICDEWASGYTYYNISFACDENCINCVEGSCLEYEAGFKAVKHIYGTPCTDEVQDYECEHAMYPGSSVCPSHQYNSNLGTTKTSQCCSRDWGCKLETFVSIACDIFDIECYEDVPGWYIERDRIAACPYHCSQCNATDCFVPRDGYYLSSSQIVSVDFVPFMTDIYYSVCNFLIPYTQDAAYNIDLIRSCKTCNNELGYCEEYMPNILVKYALTPCAQGCTRCEITPDNCIEFPVTVNIENCEKALFVEGVQEHICIVASSGYYLEHVYGNVTINMIMNCGENCIRCNKTHCLEQAPGYYMEDGGCINNCALCDEYECVRAARGYFLTADGTINKCPDGCAICDENQCIITEPNGCAVLNSNGCERALPGFRIDEDGITHMCEPNCAECDAEKCIKASPGFRFQTDVVVSGVNRHTTEEVTSIVACEANCLECNEHVCLVPATGFGIDNSVRKCFETDDAYCKTCDPFTGTCDANDLVQKPEPRNITGCKLEVDGECEVLDDGYRFEYVYEKITCWSNCEHCGEICTQPKIGYGLIDGRPVKCSSYCHTCDESGCLQLRLGWGRILDYQNRTCAGESCLSIIIDEQQHVFETISDEFTSYDDVVKCRAEGCVSCQVVETCETITDLKSFKTLFTSATMNEIVSITNVTSSVEYQFCQLEEECLEERHVFHRFDCDWTCQRCANGNSQYDLSGPLYVYRNNYYGCPNCFYQRPDGACEVAAEGYRIDSETEQTTSCQYPCAECDETKCLKLIGGWGYYDDKIVKCDPECKFCRNSKCLEPWPQYNITSVDIVKCSGGCKKCTQLACVEAYPGYSITRLTRGYDNRELISRSVVSHRCTTGCAVCSSTTQCTEVKDGYTMHNGAVVPLPEGCKRGTLQNCEEPFDGYVVMPSVIFPCQPGCLSCDSLVSCNRRGNISFTYGQSIIKCPSHCEECTADTCLKYIVECNYPHCEKCDGLERCIKAKTGYSLGGVKCEPHCAACLDNGRCIRSDPGWIITYDTYRCDPGCKVCDRYNCQVPMDGYTVTTDGKTTRCQYGCKRCTIDYCIETFPGFEMQPPQYLPCPSYAESCTSPVNVVRHQTPNVTIYQRIVEIEPNAFKNTYVTHINIPEGVTKIGSGAFSNSPLQSIAFPSTLERIEDSAFSSTLLAAVDFPHGLKYIGKQSFLNTPLRTVEFPSSLQTIDVSAFAYSLLAGNIHIPAETIVHRGAFDSLEDVYVNTSDTYWPKMISQMHPNAMYKVLRRFLNSYEDSDTYIYKLLSRYYNDTLRDLLTFRDNSSLWGVQVNDDDVMDILDGDAFDLTNYTYPEMRIYENLNMLVRETTLRSSEERPSLIRPDALYSLDDAIFQPKFFSVDDSNDHEWIKLPDINNNGWEDKYNNQWERVADTREEKTCHTTAREWHEIAFESFMPDDLANIQFSGKDFRDIVLRGVKMCFPMRKSEEFLFPKPFKCPEGCLCTTNRCIGVKPKTPFYFKDGNAVPCQEGCELCTETVCQSSSSGYFLNATNYLHQCMDGCERCNSLTTCEKADDGYLIINDQAVACEANCSRCTPHKCLEPMLGFRLTNNTLIPCDPHCDMCTDEICMRASPGYALINNAIVKNPCNIDCSLCESDKTCIQEIDMGDDFYKPPNSWWTTLHNYFIKRMGDLEEATEKVDRMRRLPYKDQFRSYVRYESLYISDPWNYDTPTSPNSACFWDAVSSASFKEQLDCSDFNTRHCKRVGGRNCYGTTLHHPMVMIDPRYPNNDEEYILPCTHGSFAIDMRDSTFDNTIGGPTFAMVDFDEQHKMNALGTLHTWAKINQAIEVQPGVVRYPDLLLGPGIRIDASKDSGIIYEYGRSRHIVSTPFEIVYISNEFKWGTMSITCETKPCVVFADMEIRDADLRGVTFDGSVHFKNVQFINVDFHGASFTEEVFYGATTFTNVRGNWFGFRSSHADVVDAYTFSNGDNAFMFWGTAPVIDNVFIDTNTASLDGVTGRYIGDIRHDDTYEQLLHYIKPVDTSWNDVERSNRATNLPFENTMAWYDRREDIPFNRVQNLPCLDTWLAWRNTPPVYKDTNVTWAGHTLEARDGVWGCGHDGNTLNGYKYFNQELIQIGQPKWKCVSGDCMTRHIENTKIYNKDVNAEHYLNTGLIRMKRYLSSTSVFFDVRWENLKSGVFQGTCPILINSGICVDSAGKQVLINYRVRLDGADLSNMDLSNVDMSIVGSMTNVNFENANLINADFGDETLYGCNLNNASLEGTAIESFSSPTTVLNIVDSSRVRTCPDSLPYGYICHDNYILGNGVRFSGQLTGSFDKFVDYQNMDLSGGTFNNFTTSPFKAIYTDVGCPILPREYSCMFTKNEQEHIILGPNLIVDLQNTTGITYIFASQDNPYLSFENMSIINGNAILTQSLGEFLLPSNMKNARLEALTFIKIRYPEEIFVEKLYAPKIFYKGNEEQQITTEIFGASATCLEFNTYSRCVSQGQMYLGSLRNISGTMQNKQIYYTSLDYSTFTDFYGSFLTFNDVSMTNTVFMNSFIENSTMKNIIAYTSIAIYDSDFNNVLIQSLSERTSFSIINGTFNNVTFIGEFEFDGLTGEHNLMFNNAIVFNTIFGSTYPTFIDTTLIGCIVERGILIDSHMEMSNRVSLIGVDVELNNTVLVNTNFMDVNKTLCFDVYNWNNVVLMGYNDFEYVSIPCDLSTFTPINMLVHANFQSLKNVHNMFYNRGVHDMLVEDDPNVHYTLPQCDDLRNMKYSSSADEPNFYVCDDVLIHDTYELEIDIEDTVALVNEHFYIASVDLNSVKKYDMSLRFKQNIYSCPSELTLHSVSRTVLPTLTAGLLVHCINDETSLIVSINTLTYETYQFQVNRPIQSAVVVHSNYFDVLEDEDDLILFICYAGYLYRTPYPYDVYNHFFSDFNIVYDEEFKEHKCEDDLILSSSDKELNKFGFNHVDKYRDGDILEALEITFNGINDAYTIFDSKCSVYERCHGMLIHNKYDWDNGEQLDTFNNILKSYDAAMLSEIDFSSIRNLNMNSSKTFGNSSFSHIDLTHLDMRSYPLHVNELSVQAHQGDHMVLPSNFLKVNTTNGFTLIGPVAWHVDIKITGHVDYHMPHFKLHILESKYIDWNSQHFNYIHFMLDERKLGPMDWTNVVWNNPNVNNYVPDGNISTGHGTITLGGTIYGQMKTCGPFTSNGPYECQDGVFVGPNTNIQDVDCSNLIFNTIYSGMTGRCGCKRGVQNCIYRTCPKPYNLPVVTSSDTDPFVTSCRDGFIFHPFMKYKNALLENLNLNGIDASNQDWSTFTLKGNRGRLNKCPTQLPDLFQCENNYIVGPHADLTDANFKGLHFNNMDAKILEGVRGMLYSCPDTLPAGFKCIYIESVAGSMIVGPGITFYGDVNIIFTEDVVNDYNRRRLRKLNEPTSRIINVVGMQIQHSNLCNVTLPYGYSCVVNNEDQSGQIVGPYLDISNFNLSGADLSNVDMRGINGYMVGINVCPDILPTGYTCATDTSNMFAPHKNFIYGPHSHFKDLRLHTLDPTDGTWTLHDSSYDILTGTFKNESCPVASRLPRNTSCINGRIYGKNARVEKTSPIVSKHDLKDMFIEMTHGERDISYRLVDSSSCEDKTHFLMKTCPANKLGYDELELNPEENQIAAVRRRLEQLKSKKINLKEYLHNSIFNRVIN